MRYTQFRYVYLNSFARHSSTRYVTPNVYLHVGGNRKVISYFLQENALTLAHETHLGNYNRKNVIFCQIIIMVLEKSRRTYK